MRMCGSKYFQLLNVNVFVITQKWTKAEKLYSVFSRTLTVRNAIPVKYFVPVRPSGKNLEAKSVKLVTSHSALFLYAL